MTPQDWGASYARAVTLTLSGATGDDAHPDDPLVWMLNAWWEPLNFSVPESLRILARRIEADTADPSAAGRPVDASASPTADRTLADAAAGHSARELTPSASRSRAIRTPRLTELPAIGCPPRRPSARPW